MQSINQHYVADHDRLDGLFRRFQSLKSTDRDGAVKSFLDFKSGLERHIVCEEEILFPSFENKTGQVGGPTTVMRLEHQEIRKYLDAIAEKLAARQDTETVAEEVGLLAMLGQHNRKEEGILYPMIDRVTDEQERTEIFAEMSRRAY